jgi:glucose-1-phosphate thymidylyltransferase
MRSTCISKCVILARGLGKRMRREDADIHLDPDQAAVADQGIKAMVPIGRPFLDYVLSTLADADFHQVCLVIGPEHQMVRDYYTVTQPPTRIEISFAVQEQPLGTANAVLAAQPFCGEDEFLVMNGDNYYPAPVLQELRRLGEQGTVLFPALALLQNSNIPQDRLRAFAECVVDENGFLVDIVEKPNDLELSESKLISMNCWRFDPEILAACREVPLSPRGEFELPLAVKLAIQRGAKFKIAISREGVLDISRRADIPVVAERLKNLRVQL